MGANVARLEPTLAFSQQAESVLKSRPRSERRLIARAIEQRAASLLATYKFARRKIPPVVGPGIQHWILVKLENYAALVNQFGTETRVHLIYHRDEQAAWAYVRCIFKVLEQRDRTDTTRIAELTLVRPKNVLASIRVYFVRGSSVRAWSRTLPDYALQ